MKSFCMFCSVGVLLAALFCFGFGFFVVVLVRVFLLLLGGS